jgi:alpha-L-rhamnosidase
MALLLPILVAAGCGVAELGSGGACSTPAATAWVDLSVADLRCERQQNPLGIDSPSPRLGWVLTSATRGQAQTAYQIVVSSSERALSEDRGDLWDSGKVRSAESVGVAYAGVPLRSGQVCFWKVRVWDAKGNATAWSRPSRWEVALLHGEDWQAEWLNDGKVNPPTDESMFTPDPAPLFRKEFLLARPVSRARLYITGLGYYEASLNGVRVGDHALDPGWTAYDRRVLYSTYDVTEALREGTNCLGVTVGNGWYNPLPLRMWGHLNLREHLPIGRPRFIARLMIEHDDGTISNIVSDRTWRTTEGPIRFNNIYLGEIYDGRLEVPGWDRPGFDDSGWRRPAVAVEPVGPPRAQSQPPIRITERIPSVGSSEPKAGVVIYDLGMNMSGWAQVRFEVPLAAGTEIRLRYGELLHADGTLNPMTSVAGQIKGVRKNERGEEESVGGPGAPPIAWQGDVYIARGSPDASGAEVYTPRFTFHGFRYVEITGLPEGTRHDGVKVAGLRLNSDVETVGSFACSNELLNRIQQMCRRTFLATILSVQSDCPHRERFAYGGDIVATSEALSLNFDMSAFYAKAVRDFSDASRPDGLFTDTAPFVGIQYCGVGWAMAHPHLISQLRREYGDDRLMAEQYDAAKRWLLKVAGDHPDGLIPQGLSDHEGLEQSPSPQMVTPLFVRSAELLAEMARNLQRVEDAERFDAIAETSRAAYRRAFPLARAAQTQASLAFSLEYGVAREQDRPAALTRLIDDLIHQRQGRHTTGIMATKHLLDQLSRAGRADVAYAMVNRRDFPGWGFMLENGATTLWEHWALSDNTFSHSHPMFGSVSQWFFNWLAGIQPAPDARAFDSILIRPQFVPGLDWVRCEHRTARGLVRGDWRREGGKIVMEIEIPVGSTAVVHVPAERVEDVFESGRPVGSPGRIDVELLRVERSVQEGAENGSVMPTRRVVCRVGSGRYTFVTVNTAERAGE